MWIFKKLLNQLFSKATCIQNIQQVNTVKNLFSTLHKTAVFLGFFFPLDYRTQQMPNLLTEKYFRNLKGWGHTYIGAAKCQEPGSAWPTHIVCLPVHRVEKFPCPDISCDRASQKIQCDWWVSSVDKEVQSNFFELTIHRLKAVV